VAFGLSLIAQEQRPSVIRLPGHALETVGQGVVAVLGAGDFDIAIARKLPTHGGYGSPVVVEGEVEAVGEQAGFEAGGAEHRLLGEGHALDGEQFLGVDRLIDAGEIGFEMGDLLEIFEADDGEGGGDEAVRAGVAGGSSLAFRGAWPVLLAALARLAASCFSVTGMRVGPLLFEELARGGRRLCDLAGQVVENKGTYFFGQGVNARGCPEVCRKLRLSPRAC
jgi:hypothetical protein